MHNLSPRQHNWVKHQSTPLQRPGAKYVGMSSCRCSTANMSVAALRSMLPCQLLPNHKEQRVPCCELQVSNSARASLAISRIKVAYNAALDPRRTLSLDHTWRKQSTTSFRQMVKAGGQHQPWVAVHHPQTTETTSAVHLKGRWPIAMLGGCAPCTYQPRQLKQSQLLERDAAQILRQQDLAMDHR
jgi:hypothetical protein